MDIERKICRRLAAVTLTVLLAAGTATAAGAHPGVAKWWQYEKVTWKHTWRHNPRLVREYRRWRTYHQDATEPEIHHERHVMRRRHLDMHFHRAISYQYGQATWYNGDGQVGACGRRLYGLYAASRTLPCGALVSVRYGGRYVLVHVLDRGPYGSSTRILDLSPKAFGWLAPLGAGVIWVHAVHLRT